MMAQQYGQQLIRTASAGYQQVQGGPAGPASAKRCLLTTRCSRPLTVNAMGGRNARPAGCRAAAHRQGVEGGAHKVALRQTEWHKSGTVCV